MGFSFYSNILIYMATFFKLILIILFPFIVGNMMPERETVYPINNELEFNPDHLDGRFTGGFGEQTCHSCHFDYDLNREGGSLTIGGIDGEYQPGKTYEITITVESEHLKNGGFQMTSRFEDGSQAGTFEWNGDRLRYTPSISDEVKYLQHGREGISPTAERKVSWTFLWNAPDEKANKVIFNIAANAGNDDDSAFGDWIYVRELTLSAGR
jgi:hypothetical protein